MTPTAKIKAIIELSRHSLSWYKEGDFKNNDLNIVFGQINNFEQNMNNITKEVRMVQQKYKLPDEEKNSKPEETLRTFIEESRQKQKQNESLFWKIKKNCDKVFKKQASSVKTIEGHLGRIAETIHGRGVGSLPSFTETNPKGLTHAITTRSGLKINKALADLGASISLMPYSMFLRLNLGELKPTRMCIELAYKSTQIPRGIVENVIVKIDKFVLLVDFVVLDMKEDHKIPIILGRPFLATTHAMIDVFKFHIIISSLLSAQEKELLLGILAKHKSALAWKATDIKVKAEIIKLLDAGLIYVIFDSPWVSPIHTGPKKGGVTVVTNKDNEPVPTRTVNGWRVCIDYRKLNDATKKVHFPLPFIDQMLERLFGNEYYCFLDRRMPFSLCNAPAIFQWCMTAIFHDMFQDFMEVFMDDFSNFGNSFDSYLNNLSMMLARCEETNLVLNWEECHFMVREGIVLGHKISKAGIEVDKAKDAKPRLIRWVLLLQEFTIEIKDRKGSKNLAVDHLSRLENPELEELDEDAIRDSFPDKHLIKKFLADVKKYIWDDPYLLKSCPDGIVKRCVFGKESHEILKHCHAGPTGGHYGADITERIVFESGFYWPTIFKDSASTAYKAPIGSTPFRIVYGKSCHLPLEMEHKAYWALKEVNIDLAAAGKHRFLQLNQLDELRTEAYEHSRAYKERTKRWHDSKIMDKEFREGEEVVIEIVIDTSGVYSDSLFVIVMKVKCKYVTRNTQKGRNNEENADSYDGLRCNTYDSVTPYPFDYRVTLGFGSIAGDLDHVNPVIRLSIEHGINSGSMAGVDINTLTMEQHLALLRDNQASGVVKPEIGGNVNFEIKSQFMRELREDTFSGNKNEDAHDHVDRVLNIVDRLIPGTVNTWDLLKKAFIQRWRWENLLNVSFQFEVHGKLLEVFQFEVIQFEVLKHLVVR
ncbi:reverse transcriptase domain-containing protein [Tanacetum coccineum]